MALAGMDIAAVRALASQLDVGGQELETIRTSVRLSLYAAPWQGSDAVAFRDAWECRHVPVLTSAASLLRETADRLRREVDEQVIASDPGGAAAVGGAVGGGGRSSGANFGAGTPWDEILASLGIGVASVSETLQH